MTDTHGNATGEAQRILVSLDVETAAFERLPPALRGMLDYMPQPVAVEAVAGPLRQGWTEWNTMRALCAWSQQEITAFAATYRARTGRAYPFAAARASIQPPPRPGPFIPSRRMALDLRRAERAAARRGIGGARDAY